MIRPQLILDVHDEIFVDNFAGGGGASTGYEMATGRHVDHAINHDPIALGMHRINHPQTVHHPTDVFDVDPTQLAGRRRVGGAWFSPDCKHFSKAKGGKPLDKKIRALALVILRWAAIRTRVIYMENVEEIATWGPLLTNGKPDLKHKGRTWNAFLAALSTGLAPDHPDIPEILAVLGNGPHPITKQDLVRGFGYHFEIQVRRAANVGTPTIRKRLYMIARCDGLPIVWPEPTHAQKPAGKLKPWRAIAECIDWDLPCPSIFLRRDEARRMRCKRPLAPATLRRVATGIGRYVLHAQEPFLVSLTHQGGDRIEPISEPIKTLTGAHRGEKALVAPTLAQTGYGEREGQKPRALNIQKPLGTVVGGGKHALVAANLMVNTTKHPGGKCDQPSATIATGGHQALVEAQLAAPFITEHANGSTQRNFPANEALRTQMANVKGGHFALVSAHVTKFNTGSVGIDARKPSPTIVAGTHSPKTHGGAASTLGLVATSLVKMRGKAERKKTGGQANLPIETISAGGNHHGVAACYLAQHNAGHNTNPGHEAREPISTVSAKGSQQQIVSASLAAYYGSEADGQPVDEALRTISTKPRFGIALSEAVAPPMTDAQIAGAHRVAKFLRDHGVEFEGEFATVGGFVIVDIGMRMLTPRELFRAQGFSNQYVIDRAWVVDPKTGEIVEVHLTKEQQIRMCGNSVCPPEACALIAANNPEMAIWNQRDRTRAHRRLEGVAA